MPKLNSRGDVICGGGGLPGSVNQIPYPFASYGRGCWFDDNGILVGLVSAGGNLHLWRPFEDPSGANLLPIGSRGFNAIAGGGGQYAALIGGAEPVLYGSVGNLPGAGAADVSLDGTIAFKTDYHAIWGLTIVRPDGSKVFRSDAAGWSQQALFNGQAIWPGGAEGRAPVRPHYADAARVRLATLEGEDWLLYWSESVQGVVLQPDGSSSGYLFVTQTMFDYDIIALNGAIVVASSRTEGEAPGDLTIIRASRSGLIYTVGFGPMPEFGPLPVPPKPPDPPIPPIPPIPPDPPKPKPPDPPIPPQPGSPYRHHRRRHMADVVVVLRGPGGKLGRPDAKNTGPWANIGAGWRGVIWDGTDKSDPRYQHRRVEQGQDYAFVHSQTGGVIGNDATKFSGNLTSQFYYKPDGDTGAGFAEIFHLYDGNANGAIEAQTEYAPGSGGDDGAFFGYPLAVESV